MTGEERLVLDLLDEALRIDELRRGRTKDQINVIARASRRAGALRGYTKETMADAILLAYRKGRGLAWDDPLEEVKTAERIHRRDVADRFVLRVADVRRGAAHVFESRGDVLQYARYVEVLEGYE